MKQKIFMLVVILAVVLLSFFMIAEKEKNSAGQPAPKTTKTEKNSKASKPQDSSDPANQASNKPSSAAKIIEAVYSASIDFYGKVVDQYGNPVPNARITCSIADNFFGTGSIRKSESDASGYFTVENIRGAGVLVSAGKDGYAEIKDKSGASFGIGMPADSVRKTPPSKQNPAVFVLRKMAKPEVMISSDRCVMISTNGIPVEISLETGKAVNSGKGDIKVECWIDDGYRDEKRRYDWRCRLTVADGGFVEREDDIENQAPEAGYQPMIEINMHRSRLDWNDSYDGNYFIKLGSGKYARASISIIPGGEFVSITSYLNPSGSRNLEYDKKLDPTRYIPER